MEILIVDGSRVMRMMLKRTLGKVVGGCTVAEAASGADALDAVELRPPDLVLCDWDIPDMTGVELLQALRSRGLATKVGFLTSEGTLEKRAQATEAGALFVVAKPFTDHVLHDALSNLRGPSTSRLRGYESRWTSGAQRRRRSARQRRQSDVTGVHESSSAS